MSTVSLTKYLSPVLLLKRKLIHILPAALIVFLFIATQFLNTEYSLKAILLSVMICLALFAHKLHTKTSLQLPNNITKLIFLYLAISLLSFIFSKTPNVGLSEITQDFSYLLIFLLLISYTKSQLNLSKLILHLAKANILIQSTLVIAQVFLLKQLRGYGTFMSFFDHKLVYPNALALSLILSVFLIQDSNKKYKSILSFLATLALLFTYSRGAIISAVFGTLIYSLILTTQKKHKEILKLAFTLILSAFVFLISSNLLTTNKIDIQEKFTFQGTEQITSLMERKQFLLLSPQLGLDNILTGYGPTSFQYIFPTIQEIPLSNSQHPHNVLIKIFIERGVIATTLFITIILLTLSFIFKHALHFKQPGLIIGLLSISLHSLIDYNFNLPLNTLFLILTLSTIWQHDTDHKNQNIKITTVALSTASIAAILFISHLTYKHPNLSPLQLQQINYKDSLIQASYQTPKTEDKIKLVSSHTIKNKYDSFAYSHLGHLYSEANQPTLAAQSFQHSIEINPKNFWYPYHQLTSLYKNNNLAYTPKEISSYISLLQEYQVAANQNLHFTSQTSNIQEAIHTTENLKSLTTQADQVSKLNLVLESLRSSQERFSSN